MGVNTSRRIRLRVLLWAFPAAALALAGVGVLGDFIYARVIEHRYDAWNAGVERHPDGVRKGCRAFTVGKGDPAVLFIHGFGDGPPVFAGVAGELAERGYTCRVMRLPGFCEPLGAYARTDLDQWASRVQEELTALRREHDVVWLAGHSTGATLAIRHALQHPDEVAGLVLFAPLIAVSHERSPVLRPRTWYQMLNPLRTFTWVVENAYPMDARDPSVADYPYRDVFVPISIYDDLYALVDEVQLSAGALATPMLMFVATEDQVVDPEVSLTFFATAGSDPKRLVERADAGHVLPLDRGWETMVEQADAFIRRAEPWKIKPEP